MAYQAVKMEHCGSKKGRGAYWGRKRYAKQESNKKRRNDGRKILEDEINPEIDSYSYHEALDRTHVLLTHLENALGDHPVILKEPQAYTLYEQSVEKLAELYQFLGTINREPEVTG